MPKRHLWDTTARVADILSILTVLSAVVVFVLGAYFGIRLQDYTSGTIPLIVAGVGFGIVSIGLLIEGILRVRDPQYNYVRDDGRTGSRLLLSGLPLLLVAGALLILVIFV